MQLQLQLAENHLQWPAAPLPLRLPVQRLVLYHRRRMRLAISSTNYCFDRFASEPSPDVGLAMLDHFIRVEFSGLPETRDMLLVRLGIPGELVLIIDGVDEAPGLQREVLMLLRQLLNSGHRFVVTSRPEGMAGENAKELLNCAECCVLNLDPLTEAQQLQAMNSQLEGEQNHVRVCAAEVGPGRLRRIRPGHTQPPATTALVLRLPKKKQIDGREKPQVGRCGERTARGNELRESERHEEMS